MMKKSIALWMVIGLMMIGGCGLCEATEAPETVAPEATEATEAAEVALPDPTAVLETAAPVETFRLWFEEGFGLDIPEGWVYYPVEDADRAAGLRYRLGDGAQTGYLYILFQPTEDDVPTFSKAVDASDNLTKTGDLTFEGLPFVAFIDEAQDASCCATVLGDHRVTFAFTPHSDSAFMLTAAQVMESFELVS